MNPIAPHITAFLRVRLPVERRASPHTCDAYAYAFQLLFEFLSRKLAMPPSKLAIEHVDNPLLCEFLDYLQKERNNSSRTRNARLAAIKSFMRYIEPRIPSALDQVRRVLEIPEQLTDARVICHLAPEEAQKLLDAPAPTTRLGIRDRAMLLLGLRGGLRVSELVGLRVDDLSFEGRYLDITVRGKRRKQRALKLWKIVGDAARAWLAVRGKASAPELFLNARGEPMTRSGVQSILDRHVATASKGCPSLATKRVTPHVLRHTCAVTTLRATRDLRKVALWLGHASTQTTEIYTEMDPSEKVEMLGEMAPPNLRPGKFSPPDRLIASLRAD